MRAIQQKYNYKNKLAKDNESYNKFTTMKKEMRATNDAEYARDLIRRAIIT